METTERNTGKRGGYKPRYLKKKTSHHVLNFLLRGLVTVIAAALCFGPTVNMLKLVALGSGTGSAASTGGESANWAIMDRFDMYMTNQLSDALDGVKVIEKVYWLSDEDQIAPEPNPDCYGTTDDPSTLQWLLDEAKEKLGVEDTYFSTETKLMPGSKVTYYLDDTILSITWKQITNGGVYTISEVKIAHPSQFRRFLADGTYGAEKQYYPSEMAITVNAVAASSGDFYKFRSWGVNVYQGTVRNVKTTVDSCFIDQNGDLLFKWAGELSTVEEAQQFVDENGIRFSLAFGPIMIVDGENVVPSSYPLGEINDHYARMALCQMGELHYMMVAVNQEGGYANNPTTDGFAEILLSFGVDQAYALDGGQTAAIITNDTLINRPVYGYQRQISDIIYFATAIPESKWAE